MSSRNMKRKVLLMGKSGSGKTSMRSIIFANYLARDTMRLGPTLGIENSHVRFLGNLLLSLWDCGGQDSFMEKYFESQRDAIFRNVEVLIYVFDIESADRKKDVEQFANCMAALSQHSKQSAVFCLIHKMDLIHKEEDRVKVFTERSNELRRIHLPSSSSTLTCFPTSIWDETLYKAWSSIVHSLIPNIAQLEHQLQRFCLLLQAEEVVLFEKATFLVISSAVRRVNGDAHRYEKISNIIKQFKLSCSKSSQGFVSMEVQNRHFIAFIDQLTTNTYVMIVGKKMLSAAVNLNVRVARPHFEKFVQQNVRHAASVHSCIAPCWQLSCIAASCSRRCCLVRCCACAVLWTDVLSCAASLLYICRCG